MSMFGKITTGYRAVAFKVETIVPITDPSDEDPIESLTRQLNRRHTDRTLLRGLVRRERVDDGTRADYAILLSPPGTDKRQSIATHTTRLWNDFDTAGLNDRLRLAEVRSFPDDLLGRIALNGIWQHFEDHTSHLREMEFNRFLPGQTLESGDSV